MRSRPVARSLLLSAYLPTFLAETGIGAILPVLTLSVLDMGHSATAASFAVGVYSAGRIAGGAGGGAIAHRWGATRAAMGGMAVVAVGSALCAVAPDLGTFLLGAAIIGLGHAAFHVARQEQISHIVGATARARALTTLAGVWRIAYFVGPLAAAGLLAARGDQVAYAVSAACVVAGMVALRLAPAWRERHLAQVPERAPLLGVIRDNARVLATLGAAVVLTGALRTVRVAVVPLWATHIGLSAHTATLIYAASAAIDMVMFYPAGWTADRFGVIWTAVPSSLALGAGIALLPFASTASGVALAALVLGLGNGWGSGLIMTLGADVAPEQGRSVFIGVWMVLQDAGGLAGPAILSGLAAASLASALWATGGLGLVTAGGMWRWAPRGPASGRRADAAP